MDRELATEFVNRSRRKSWLIGLAIVGGLVIGILALQSVLKTTVDGSKIRTALVQTGPVENTLSATGEVIPAYEQTIASPIRASIRKVLLTSGARLQPGMAILELDKSLTQIDYEKLQDQVALKQNGIKQLRMKLDKDLYDANVSDQIKRLSINKLKAESLRFSQPGCG